MSPRPAHHVHVFRTQRRADNDERLALAIENELDALADLKAVRLCERLAENDLLVTVIRESRTSNQTQAVDGAVETGHRRRYQTAADRPRLIRQIEDDAEDDARFERGDARQIGHPLDDAEGRLLDVDPEVGETVVAIVRSLAALENALRRTHPDKRPRADRDNDHHRQQRPNVVAKVA